MAETNKVTYGDLKRKSLVELVKRFEDEVTNNPDNGVPSVNDFLYRETNNDLLTDVLTDNDIVQYAKRIVDLFDDIYDNDDYEDDEYEDSGTFENDDEDYEDDEEDDDEHVSRIEYHIKDLLKDIL